MGVRRRSTGAASTTLRAVPRELLDVGDATWASERDSRRWFEAHRLKPRRYHADDDLMRGPHSRHDLAVVTWAEAQGYSLRYGAPNRFRRAEFGIPMSDRLREMAFEMENEHGRSRR